MSYNSFVKYLVGLMLKTHPSYANELDKRKSYYVKICHLYLNGYSHPFKKHKVDGTFKKVELCVIAVAFITSFLLTKFNIWLSLSIALFIGKNLEFFYYEEYKHLIYYVLVKSLYRVKIYSRFRMVFGYNLVIMAEDQYGWVYIGPLDKYEKEFKELYEDVDIYILPPFSIYRYVFDYASCRFKYPNLGSLILGLVRQINMFSNMEEHLDN